MSESEILKLRELKKISNLESKVENLEIDILELKQILKTKTEFGNRIVEILAKMDKMLQDPRLKYLMKKYGPPGGAETPEHQSSDSEDENSGLEDQLEDDLLSEDRVEAKVEVQEEMDEDSTATAFYFDRSTPDSGPDTTKASTMKGIRH